MSIWALSLFKRDNTKKRIKGDNPIKVLIIKTSSLGDVLHTLPALTDAGKAIPGVRFDWVVEESFSEIPTWHPLVDRVIPVALRRWRKTPIKSFFSEEWKKFRREIKAEKYDFVIDAQGLMKSAFLTKMARGLRVGLNRRSLTESFALCAYQKTVDVDLKLHAVFRMRSIFAQALGYDLPETVADYGLSRELLQKDDWNHGNYFVFIHGTTWPTKLWPEKQWCELAKLVANAGYQIRLPWGSSEERERAENIAQVSEHVFILPKSSLSSLAGVLAGAKGIVAVDTGLGHLAAALNVPSISLYGPTDPKRIGTIGEHQNHLSSDFQCLYCDKPKCRFAGQKGYKIMPACFEGLTAHLVWERLQQLFQ